MKTTLVAAKPLVLDGKQVAAGETVATVETAHDLTRVLNGALGGAIVSAETFEQIKAAKKPAAAAVEKK